MSTASFLRLICLAAIWGGSFLFMKIAANTFGPAYLIEFRVGFAAISLFLVSLYLRKKLAFRNHFKHFMIIGLFNTALPFFIVRLRRSNTQCIDFVRSQLNCGDLGSTDWRVLA